MNYNPSSCFPLASSPVSYHLYLLYIRVGVGVGAITGSSSFSAGTGGGCSTSWSSSMVTPALVLSPAPPSGLLLSGPVFGKTHYYVLILCLWVSERMAASGCWRPGSGKDVMGHWRVTSLLSILSFIFSSSTKSVSCLGQCLQSLSPTWFLSASFLFRVF